MSRVCKKIAGLFGLAFVVGITAVATGIPPVQKASAASDVNVSFKVTNNNNAFTAQVIQPIDGSTSYSSGGITTRISYANAQSISVYLTFPDNHQVLVDTINPPNGDPGELDIALPVYELGSYTITVSGTDLSGSAMAGDTKAFSYRSVTLDIDNENNKITADYGTDVCRLGFQVYRVTDTERQNPLLNPEYSIEVQQTGSVPNIIDVEIPDFSNLGPDEFTVVVTAYDCLNDDALDSDNIKVAGVVTPPKTGAISILGMTISQTDYLVTGIVIFALAAIFAIFLLSRRKKAPRRR